MIPTEPLHASAGNDAITPFLYWSALIPCLGGAAMACPQCAGANLHLDTIHFAVPTEDHYTPTVGVSITPHTGTIAARDEACHLHAGTNRGPMLAIGYWCENGCHGRIELREHKGYLFATLHEAEPAEPQKVGGSSPFGRATSY